MNKEQQLFEKFHKILCRVLCFITFAYYTSYPEDAVMIFSIIQKILLKIQCDKEDFEEEFNELEQILSRFETVETIRDVDKLEETHGEPNYKEWFIDFQQSIYLIYFNCIKLIETWKSIEDIKNDKETFCFI
jgi:hypothetical protein